MMALKASQHQVESSTTAGKSNHPSGSPKLVKVDLEEQGARECTSYNIIVTVVPLAQTGLKSDAYNEIPSNK